jgi:hypothetical protein
MKGGDMADSTPGKSAANSRSDGPEADLGGMLANFVPPYKITPSEVPGWVIFNVYNEDKGTYSSKTVRLEDVPTLIREFSRQARN